MRLIRTREHAPQSGVAIGVLLFAPIVLVQLYWLLTGYSAVTAIHEGWWGLYVALFLLLSYLIPWRSRIFRGVLWIFRTIHVPRGEWVALFYAAALAAGSVYMLVTGSDRVF